MKLKKLMALVSVAALAITTTVISPIISANADEGITATFVAGERYALNATKTGVAVDVYVNLPESFSKYNQGEDPETLDTVYSGNVLQMLSIDIPYVDGLKFMAARSSIVDTDLTTAGASITDNSSDSKVQIFMNNTTPATMYSGTLNHVATLVYMFTGDLANSYTIAPSDVFAQVYKWNGGSSSIATVTQYPIGKFTVTNAVSAPAVTKTLSSIAVDKTAIEVAGGAEYDLSTIVTTATYSDDSTEAVTPTWTTDKGSISGTTFTAPAAIVDEPQTITLTATYEGKTATVTVTVPAAPKPEFSCSTKSVAPYYSQTTGKTLRRFECSATNMTEASSFLFTFVSGGTTKPFTSAKPTIGGGAAYEFEVMILGAPEDTKLTVTEAK